MEATEKKVSHTPGPWEAVEEFEGWAVIRSESTAKQYIATEINQGHDMGEADAKLIAAAPELLKSLQWLMKQIPELKGEISLIGMGKCYEAIKKATVNP